MQDKRDQVRRVHWVLASQIIIITLLSTVLVGLSAEVNEYRSSLSDQEMQNIIMAGKVTLLLFTLQSNVGIILGYLVIYIILFRYYRQQQDSIAHKLKIAMRRNLLSFLILFLSICQIYIFRTYRDFTFIVHDLKAKGETHHVIYFCKIIQITGICVSLYLRLLNNPKEEEENANDIDTKTDSLFLNQHTGSVDKQRLFSMNLNNYGNVQVPQGALGV